VDEVDDRPLLLWVEARRLEDPHLHLDAALDGYGHAFGEWQVELVGDRVICSADVTVPPLPAARATGAIAEEK